MTAALDRLRNLLNDEKGAFAIALAVALPAVAGLSFLAVDVGRLYNLHTSLQASADAFALVAAAELDRQPDAIVRADRAIGRELQEGKDPLLANVQRFGDGAAALTASDLSVRYLSDLQPERQATDYRDARYVEVSIQPVALSNPTIASLLGIAGPVETSARAVAGFTQGICQYSPFFICNPFEDSGNSIFKEAETHSWRGKLIGLRAKSGQQGQYGPGNYGALAAPPNGGANGLRDMLAMAHPNSCLVQEGVETEPGFMSGPMSQGINVRFDEYSGTLSNKKHDPLYRPARNIRGYPRDECLSQQNCPPLGADTSSNRFGDGKWDFEGYWSSQHGNRVKPSSPGAQFYSNANPPSRYEIHKYELAEGLHESPSGSSELLQQTPDRRLLYAAILDCKAHQIQGRVSDIPVTAYARLFLTEPVGSDDTIWAEMVGLIEPGTPGAQEVLRDIVQLYR